MRTSFEKDWRIVFSCESSDQFEKDPQVCMLYIGDEQLPMFIFLNVAEVIFTNLYIKITAPKISEDGIMKKRLTKFYFSWNYTLVNWQ